MFPYIHLGRWALPTYGLSYVAAVLLFAAVSLWLAPRFGNRRESTFYSAIFGVVGLILGLKLMAAAFALPQVLANRAGYSSPLQVLGALFGGNRFFGGLLGGVLGVWVYARLYKKPFSQTVENLVPGFTVAFAVVRLAALRRAAATVCPTTGPLAWCLRTAPLHRRGWLCSPLSCARAFLIW